MHKNKRKKQKEKGKWKAIIEWSVVIIVGLVIGAFVANWINTLPFAQPHYARPSELSFQSGIPLLIGYCMGLVLMIICGYLFGRRTDESKR